uniref:(California timema) hypothetical protein n=2 Tax=Timema TaxID=61471 RepID=A0A7R9J7L0_TIMCA|nr:unnamed protein product [Timema californicum]
MIDGAHSSSAPMDTLDSAQQDQAHLVRTRKVVLRKPTFTGVYKDASLVMFGLLGMVRVLTGKPNGKRPLGIPKRKWADNIRMDLKAIGCNEVDWIEVVQYRAQW